MNLAAGEAVYVGDQSSVTLYFPAAGCEMTVNADDYYEVGTEAPCRTAAAPERKAAPGDAGLGLAIGAAAAAGGALAALALTGQSESDNGTAPATPQ